MYTQCPDCSTVFRVTAEALRVAQGRVRCGICSAGFNALDNLSEAPVPRTLGEDADEDTITVEEMPGNEFIELSGLPEDGIDEATGREAGEAEPPAGDLKEDAAAWEAPAQEDLGEQGVSRPDLATGEPAEEEPAADERAAEHLAEEESAWEESAEEVRAGEEPVAKQPASEEAGEAQHADTEPAGEEPTDEAAEGPATGGGEDTPAGDLLDSLPDKALEFHGSAEDLEKLFVSAGALAYGREPDPADVPLAIDRIASQDLSGIEVREDDFDWPDSSDSPFDPGNPAHVAAVLASSSGEAQARREGDLDRTDEYPVLVVEDYEAALASGQGTGDEPGDEPAPGGAADSATAEQAASAGELPPVGTAEPEAGAAPAAKVDDDGSGPVEPATTTQEESASDTSEPQDEPPLLIIPEELRHGPSATAADDLAAPLDLDEESPRRWPLAVAAGLLAAVLGAQLIHHWRQDLVRNPATGPWMLRGYHALGLELRPPVDLGAFELRQLGAASDPGQAGRIKLRASIVNNAPFAQPYPLLRLSLQDRFGSTIGARNLTPEEYLPGAAADASGLIGASQRADAEVVFVDPGREAVGFELDVCAAGEAGLRCSADLARSAP